jgi:CRISPR-associated protein Cmr6
LTVAPKTTFVFRAIINKHRKDYESLKQSIKKILEQALTKEGIGAKTALGYGLFEK